MAGGKTMMYRKMSPDAERKQGEIMEVLSISLMIWSPAFSNGDMIPAIYTADGQDLSPPLQWECTGNPGSFALICEDPDAPMGTWVHWVVFNIPGESRMLPQGVPAAEELEDGTLQGTNSWGNTGYGGPAPPSGKHRYFFRLYALDGMLNLLPGATAEELRAALSEALLVEASFMGEYSRQ